VLGGNVLVLEIGRFFESAVEQAVERIRHLGLRRAAAGNLGQAFDVTIDIAQQRLRANAHLLQHRRHNALSIFEQRCQQVQRLQFRIAVLGCKLARALDRLLRFYRKFVPANCHGMNSLQKLSQL
jgi:hypothetical protein